MKLSSFIAENTILMNLSGFTKQQALDELIDVLDRAGKLNDKNSARQAVIERESQLSTGLGNGIAVPHGKTNAVTELVAAFGIKQEGIQFDSADGQPAHIFFMLVSPLDVSGPHIKALASIARFLRVKDNRDLLLKAKSPTEVLSIFESDI